MTKQEFIERLKRDFDFTPDGNLLDSYLDDLIQTAIDDRERAILDDIEFGYDLEMIKGKLINKSYQP